MSKQLNVSNIDFFQIKENFKQFLKNQDQFSDYNFEGSGLSVMLDIMAYGIHMTGVHTNLAFAETFLDSAVQRGSVVSRAKELGYVPRSMSGAKATVNLSFSVAGNPAQYVLPKNTKFSASNGATTFSFVTVEDHIFENESGVFSKDIDIFQGKFTTYTYTVNTADASQRFVVPAQNVDRRFLSVLMKESDSEVVSTSWEFIDNFINIGDIKETTQVYFLQETADGLFEVYFGDDVIGKAVKTGNIVQLNYLITDGGAANDIKSFAFASSLSGISAVTVTTLDAASGGADKESVDSIKYLAPFYYQAQKRAVTEDDYKALLKSTYAEVDDVSVWGGEKNDPPFYGKVFIAIKPKSSTFLSNLTKQSIEKAILSRFNVTGIRPEIVDPEYIDVSVRVVVTYNGRLFVPSSNIDLEQTVRDTVTNFFKAEANLFGKPLYYSKLVKAIDESSDLILNSTTNLMLEKSQEIFTGISGQYTFQFNNALHAGSLTSNPFTIDGVTWKIKDMENASDPTKGTLAVYRTTDQGNVIYLSQDVGTIDYNSGEVKIQNLRIDSIINDPIYKRLTISVSPGAFIDVNNPTTAFVDFNVYTNERDQLIRLKPSGVSVILLPDNSV